MPSQTGTAQLLAVVFALIAVNGGPTVAHAKQSHQTPTDYSITSWSKDEGVPPGQIRALAQDNAGYLWIGSDGGLVRFDGFEFDRWSTISGAPLPAENSVHALHVSRDGALWVGFGASLGAIPPGPLSRILGSQLQTYGPRNGLPQLSVDAIEEDAEGTIFVANPAGLFSLSGDKWERWTIDRGMPEGPAYALYLAQQGDFFAVTSQGLFRRRKGQGRFVPVEYFPNMPSTRGHLHRASAVCEDPNGTLYVSDSKVGVRIASGPEPVNDVGRGVQVVCDKRGNVWVGTVGEGLWHTRYETGTGSLAVERLTALDGLVGEGASAVLEDRDGNIWAGSTAGLSRITPSKVGRLTSIQGVAALESTPDGSIWIGTTRGLFRSSKETNAARQVLPAARVSVMHVDGRGTLWAATDRGVVRFVNGVPAPVEVPGLGPSGPLHQIDSLATDAGDGLWLYDLERGLFHWRHGDLEASSVPPTLKEMKVTTVFTDRGGNTWFTSDTGSVARLSLDGNLHVFSTSDGLSAGTYQIVYEDREGVIWLAATRGLTRFVGDRFQTVYRDDSVEAIVEDDRGDIWFASSSGILHADRREFDRQNADPAYRVQYQRYEIADGVAGFPLQLGSRTAVRSKDGHLWFVTGRGLTIIDPQAAALSPRTVGTRIQRIVADGHGLDMSSKIVLPPETKTVQFEYSALNLNSAQKTRFRYDLEGFDPQWTDAGERRTAYYTNLPPGTYAFHVADDSGQGRGAGEAVVTFTVQPRFYQTMWFPLLCIGVLGATIWAAWTIRWRVVRHEFAVIIEERARLSREIHDTLLQGLVGIALHLEHVSADPSAPDARPRLIRMRERVEQYIREARRTIMDLRTPDVEPCGLAQAVQKIGDDAVYGHAVSFELTTIGTPVACSAAVQEQFVRVMQEAMSNCIQHAAARTIRAELEFTASSVRLRILDDGRGFDAGSERKNGHFGMVTMAERAKAMGGAFSTASAPAAGCRVEITVPIASIG